ncbi:hypothetical protein [Marinilabilia rubra]|uniref:DUF7847 domain-containing protein n=1 Tax=Marinilabilia rubra TaxID=2162893 RepID=A0A2U2BDH5_9BACT|nr:hypothetical protein [Marinilabilia rubra]PWE01110.1 hypothetical protein DDZ16_01075 [Marinilabilia rubra]
MNNRPEIELKRERDFSDVFNASFAFLSQEIKRLTRVVAMYAGVPVIIAIIMSAYYTQDTFSTMFQVMSGTNVSTIPDPMLIFLTIVISFLATIFLAGLIPAYMGEYEEKGKNGFGAEDVWKRFARHFGAIIGFSILGSIIVTVGFFLLIIPGIYLSVPMAFLLFVKVIEDKNLGDTFSRCFQLVRNNWWITFGIIILAYIIISIVSWLFSVPALIVGGIQGFLVGSGEQEAFQTDSLAFILTTVISGLGQYILYPVLYIIIAFQYYSLREQKDRDTLMGKVSAINEEE